MNVPLREGYLDARFAAQAVNAKADFSADLQGIRSPDIKPEINMKNQGIVAESFKGHGSGWFFQDLGLTVDRSGEGAYCQLCGCAIGNADNEIVTVMRVGERPVNDVLFEQVAVRNENIHTIKFSNAGATRAQIYDMAKISIDVDEIATFIRCSASRIRPLMKLFMRV
jgi:hypothetical protein